MKVAEDYRATASDEYTINTELINSAQTAAANARAIVNQNAGKSDYAKLMTYKRKICELTDYNEDAAEGKHLHDYGNPWQLVWVFDGNPETKVVCEGYSKAFQYLCEQSRWSGDVEVIKDIAISTKEHYRVLLNGRILPALGNLYVQDISPRDIQMFYLSLKKQKALTKRSKTGSLSGTTQLHYHRCLHALLEYARQEGIITINPASAVKPPKKDTPKARFYNPEDCAKLLDVLDQLPLIWRLYYYLAL